MNIKITEFALRHFDKSFGGTKILNTTPENFEIHINNEICYVNDNRNNSQPITNLYDSYVKVMKGYADFCTLVAIKNTTDARVGSTLITLENYQYIRSGYSARRESELPIFSRWLELPIAPPLAKYLILVLYSKEQLQKEDKQPFDADYGVVAILGQSHDNEEPMKPETMIRNALGIEEGGSGVPLDKEKYMQSVNFWKDNITVK